METNVDIVTAISMILMWLMGFWAHWYRTLIKKQKVTRRLFDLAEEYELKSLENVNSNGNYILIGYRYSGKSSAYVYSAKIVSENL